MTQARRQPQRQPRPPQPRPRQPPRRGANFTTVAAAALIGAVLVVIAILQLASNPSVKNQLGERVFVAGRATDLAHQIATPAHDGRKGPLLFQALVRDRDIFLQHLGSDPSSGWLALEAHAPGAPRTCVLNWNDAANQFRDPCNAKTYPADGAGLVHFSATVDPVTKRVVVDLRQPVLGQ